MKPVERLNLTTRDLEIKKLVLSIEAVNQCLAQLQEIGLERFHLGQIEAIKLGLEVCLEQAVVPTTQLRHGH